jgi:hypothetical protein
LWESNSFLLLSLKYYKKNKAAGALKDQQHEAIAIAKATGLQHIQQGELGRKIATSGSFCGKLRYIAIAEANLVDLPLSPHFFFSVMFFLFLVT